MAMVSRSEFLPWLPPMGRKTLFALALFGICFAFAFPVLWLILTSLRPESGVYYVHRGTEFTLSSFAEVLSDDRIVGAFLNLDLGRGSAAAIIGGLIILVIGVVLYRLVDRIAKA